MFKYGAQFKSYQNKNHINLKCFHITFLFLFRLLIHITYITRLDYGLFSTGTQRGLLAELYTVGFPILA